MTETDFSLMETALAIYDEFISRPRAGDGDDAIQQWRDDNGMAALRALAIGLAPAFERVWNALSPQQRDSVTWDWEFVPALVDTLDFSADQPQADEIAMTNAAHALIARVGMKLAA